MTLWAVVPVKALDAAKGRLAPLLTLPERQALAGALLADVLAALCASPSVGRVLLVSADPAALALAESLGASPLPETPPGPASRPEPAPAAGRGGSGPPPDTRSRPAIRPSPGLAGAEAPLNAALDQAAATAAAGGATALLALPADLPLVTAVDIEALSAHWPAQPSVVLAGTPDGGTGALLRSPPAAIPAAFGPDSLRAHLRAARERRVHARLVWRPNLALDVDSPADLERLFAHPAVGVHTAAWLSHWQQTVDRGSPLGQAIGTTRRE
jgi:2-phospho-L-lactate guanylyltransferase